MLLSPRNGHIRKAVVNQQFALVCVHVNQNSVRSLSLAAVAGYCISVVEMRMLTNIESTRPERNVRPSWCREGESNPHSPFGPADFKSAASANFAIPARELF